MSKAALIKLIEEVIIRMPNREDNPEYIIFDKAQAFDEIADIITRQPFWEFAAEKRTQASKPKGQ